MFLRQDDGTMPWPIEQQDDGWPRSLWYGSERLWKELKSLKKQPPSSAPKEKRAQWPHSWSWRSSWGKQRHCSWSKAMTSRTWKSFWMTVPEPWKVPKMTSRSWSKLVAKLKVSVAKVQAAKNQSKSEQFFAKRQHSLQKRQVLEPFAKKVLSCDDTPCKRDAQIWEGLIFNTGLPAARRQAQKCLHSSGKRTSRENYFSSVVHQQLLSLGDSPELRSLSNNGWWCGSFSSSWSSLYSTYWATFTLSIVNLRSGSFCRLGTMCTCDMDLVRREFQRYSAV